MSVYLSPAAGKSGLFKASAAPEEVQLISTWNGQFEVPQGYRGAIVHAQFSMGVQLPADSGRSVLADIMANGVKVSESRAAAGKNNCGDVSIGSTSTAHILGPGVYTMSITLKILDCDGGTNPLNRTVLATGSPAALPSEGGRTMAFEFKHYIVQLF